MDAAVVPLSSLDIVLLVLMAVLVASLAQRVCDVLISGDSRPLALTALLVSAGVHSCASRSQVGLKAYTFRLHPRALLISKARGTCYWWVANLPLEIIGTSHAHTHGRGERAFRASI